MGACASKPNVLNGEAPEVAPENIVAKDVEVVVKEEVVKKEETVIVDDDADHTPSLYNLLNNEEGKGSTEEKEETSVKASEVASPEEKIELEVEKVFDDSPKAGATNFVDDEKKIEEVKSETVVEEVVKPSVESENKKDDQEKLPEEAPAEKTVEDVKLVEKPTATEDKKIEEKPEVDYLNSEVEKKKTEVKPVVTKKGKFWWDK
ncbi:uncharacterized protein LOC129894729 [Solanum dulcamara]|uniref:uncharacterized protein LOC129894729 n=1 Tax=Solanum dulcamara TaxID=45834 RepID=UPI0024859B61|nr:uncharacterized protein LOC129894729 [Solanum dulcamara]